MAGWPFKVSRPSGGCRSTRRPGDDDPRRPQQPPVELVAGLHDLEHGVWLGRCRLLHHHGLVAGRVEGLTQGVYYGDAELLQRLDEELERRLLAFGEAP